MKLRHLLVAASVVVLSACATSTPYQEASKPGAFDGFSQTLIENDRARVSFAGNSVTERDTVENYLLYRAAELAVERGFESFTLLERNVEEKTRLSGGANFAGSRFGGVYDPFFDYSFYRPGFGWSRGTRFSSFGGFRRGFGFGSSRFGRSSFGGRGFGGFGSYRGGFYDNVREITKYRASAEVKFARFQKSGENDNSFNAREVLENLGPTIVLPEEKA